MAKKVFTQKELKNLDIFEYKSVCYSILTNTILDPLYSIMVYLIPMSITPNQITVFNGLLYTIFTVIFTTSFYSDEHPLLSKIFDTPVVLNQSVSNIFESYGFYLNAFFLVLYQCLDSLDGKQARRTKSSTPIGHLLDHGIDALVTGLVCINLFHLLGLSNNQFYAYLSCCLVVFFLNTWEEFHTKVLYFGLLSGAVEGLFAMSGLLILFPSKEHWHYKMIQNSQIIGAIELICRFVLNSLISVTSAVSDLLLKVDDVISVHVVNSFTDKLTATLNAAVSFLSKSRTDDNKKAPLQELYAFLVGKQGLFNFTLGMNLIQLLIIISITFTAVSSLSCIFNVLRKKKLSGLVKTAQFIPYFGVNAMVLYYLITSPLTAEPKQFLFLIFGWVFTLAYANVSITCARILNNAFPVFPKVYLGYFALIILKLVHLDIIQ
eukprot:NODE_110_length_19453_cov_0.364369.p4 type:complete len:434 gc:universal NODE_110_length_19453_cov_0.364369:7346-8647(+)